jgi:hypothetical protein
MRGVTAITCSLEANAWEANAYCFGTAAAQNDDAKQVPAEGDPTGAPTGDLNSEATTWVPANHCS